MEFDNDYSMWWDDIFDDDDRDNFTQAEYDNYFRHVEEQKEQRKRELKALKKELNLPHKLRMDIDEAMQLVLQQYCLQDC